MRNEEYEDFERPFREAARPILEALISKGLGPLSEIEVLDFDIDRGLGFASEDPDKTGLFVHLVLADGEDRGYEGVGLLMTCSIFPNGQIWAPGNYSMQVGAITVDDLIARLGRLANGVQDYAIAVEREWKAVDQREAEEAGRGSARGGRGRPRHERPTFRR
jgi:hypothetical protein